MQLRMYIGILELGFGAWNEVETHRGHVKKCCHKVFVYDICIIDMGGVHLSFSYGSIIILEIPLICWWKICVMVLVLFRHVFSISFGHYYGYTSR
jgi:hypothetical protein